MGLLRDLKRKADEKLIETPPEGFKTTAEWAVEEGCAESYVAKLLKDLEKEGLIERKKFRRPKLDGTPYPIDHFRLKPAPAPKPATSECFPVPVSRKAKK